MALLMVMRVQQGGLLSQGALLRALDLPRRCTMDIKNGAQGKSTATYILAVGVALNWGGLMYV